MNLNAVISHPVTQMAVKVSQVLMATAISLAGVVLGSILGFISIGLLVAAMLKTPEADILAGAMWFGGCICAAMLVGYGLRTLAMIGIRILDLDADGEIGSVVAVLKKSKN